MEHCMGKGEMYIEDNNNKNMYKIKRKKYALFWFFNSHTSYIWSMCVYVIDLLIINI